MMSYLVEYQKFSTGEHVHLEDIASDLKRARNRARYLSKNDDIGLTYVVACDESDGRVGAETYANGHKSHLEGRIR